MYLLLWRTRPGVFLGRPVNDQIELWLGELKRWNSVHNLVSPRQIPLLGEHVADSLSLVPFLNQNLVVDAGSGGGFPVIPLAIYAKFHDLPVRFVATDVVDKKIAFLKWSVKRFRLNVDIIKVDKNFLIEEECMLISRAFASVEKLAAWKNKHTPFCSEMFLLKGRNAVEETVRSGMENAQFIPNQRGFIVKICLK